MVLQSIWLAASRSRDAEAIQVYADACEEAGRTMEAAWVRWRKDLPLPPNDRAKILSRHKIDPDCADPIAEMSAQAQEYWAPLIPDAIAEIEIGKFSAVENPRACSFYYRDPAGCWYDFRRFAHWSAGLTGLLLSLVPIAQYNVQILSRAIDTSAESEMACVHFLFSDTPVALRFGGLSVATYTAGERAWAWLAPIPPAPLLGGRLSPFA